MNTVSQESDLLDNEIFKDVENEIGHDLINQIANESHSFNYSNGIYYNSINNKMTDQRICKEELIYESRNIISQVHHSNNIHGTLQNENNNFINSIEQTGFLNAIHQQSNMKFPYNNVIESQSMTLPLSPVQYSIKHFPTAVDFSGDLNFSISLNTSAKNNTYVYSEKLNKVFIKMDKTLAVHFRWYPINAENGRLYIRAMAMFSDPQHSKDIVKRCVQHDQANGIYNQNISKHVIRCESKNTTYHGNHKENEHLSVLTALGVPQPGIDYVELLYIFTCQNSCATGMNRKPIEVVFTLESCEGLTLGRKKLPVRICCCPKRDKEKEELDLSRMEENDFIRTKRRKTTLSNRKQFCIVQNENNLGSPSDFQDIVDNSIYFMCPVPIYGKENYYRCLKYMYDLHAGEMIRTQKDSPFKSILKKIDDYMKNAPPERIMNSLSFSNQK